MISKHDFFSTTGNRQFFPDLSEDFPCLCRYSDPDQIVSRLIPWHWHSAIEINYVTEGIFIFSTDGAEYSIQKGEAIFVNSDALHMTRWNDTERGGKLLSLIFDSTFLSGIHGNLYEQKYLLPILGCKGLQAYYIKPDTEPHLQMILCLLRVFHLFEEEPFGYEFRVRSELSSFWCRLLETTKAFREQNRPMAKPEHIRMKPMLEYIHTHYAEKVRLEQVALAGAVSSRECSRCFQKCIRMSPVDYLNLYRARMAAYLLVNSEKSIADIAEDCGFSSSSYFNKVFQKEFGRTPNAYRKEQKSEHS